MAACLAAGASTAQDLYWQGRRAERAGHLAQAYILYSQAAAKDPGNRMYWLRALEVRDRAEKDAKPAPAAAAGTAAPAVGPAQADAPSPPDLDRPSLQDVAEAREALPPPELKAQAGKKDLDFQGDSKTLFQDVARVFGLDCVFDGGYQPVPQFRFRLADVDYRDALHGLEAATGSFIVPLSDKLFLVAKDTAQKRQELEPAISVVVNLPETTSQQDLTAAIEAVRQAMAIEKAGFDTQKNILVIRDRISKVIPAQALLEDLLRPRAQVMIDLEMLEVSRNDAITWGLDLPGIFTLSPINNPYRLAQLVKVGLSETLGLTILSASVEATLSATTGKNLLTAHLRSADGQPATFHVGDRYPILTSGYFGPASFSGPGAYTPPPSFTYEDLGLSLKVTPAVHGMDEVTLDVEAEFKVLTGAQLDNIPVIGSQVLKSKTRLRMGEWAVVGGLLSAQDARNIAGIAGLARVPYLGALTSMHDTKKTEDRILLLLRPRLISLPPSEGVAHEYRVGSETHPVTPL